MTGGMKRIYIIIILLVFILLAIRSMALPQFSDPGRDSIQKGSGQRISNPADTAGKYIKWPANIDGP